MNDDLTPSSQEDIEKVLTGGVPLGRWKEGQLFEGWYVDDVRIDTDDAPVAFHLGEPSIKE